MEAREMEVTYVGSAGFLVIRAKEGQAGTLAELVSDWDGVTFAAVLGEGPYDVIVGARYKEYTGLLELVARIEETGLVLNPTLLPIRDWHDPTGLHPIP